MANMSYIRFENTLSDLQDCENALSEKSLEELSQSEQKHAKWLIELCREIADNYEHLITD
jgi:TfoX/Sxy family transcriptional regulator of competence genes